MSPQPIQLGPYLGGVNLVDKKLDRNELSVCTNIRIGVKGEIVKRPGHDNYGSAPAKVNGDVPVNLCCRYYKSDGTKKLIAAAGGKLRFGNDVTGAWTDISINGTGASMEANKLADWAVYKDRLYITDGTAVQRYNGTDDIYAGHFIHNAPVLAQSAGGSLTLLATYKYLVISVAGNMGRGPASAEASITLVGANNRVTLDPITIAPAKHEETFKRIYRTKANGSIFYFLAEIATGVTSYQDNLADTVLGEEFVPSKIPPATARFVIIGHDERAYWFGMSGADASLVNVSDIGFPDRILNNGVDGFFTVANNDGDILTGGGLVPGGILFLKRNSAWLSRAYGYGLINISPREKKGSGTGTVSPFSVVSTPIGLLFLSQRFELYKFDGTNLEEIGRKIASEFKGMNDVSLGKIVACYHDYRYQISYDYRSSKGYNWRTMEYDILTGKWEGPHENDIYYTPSYYSVFDSQLDKGELYWGESRGTNGSYVYGRSEFSKTDRGQKFLSRIVSGRARLQDHGELLSYKVFVDGDISSDTFLQFSHIDDLEKKTTVILNSGISSTSRKLGPSPQVLKLAPPVGNSLMGGKSKRVLEGSLGPSARARLPMFEFSDNKSAVEMEINSVSLLVNPLPLR